MALGAFLGLVGCGEREAARAREDRIAGGAPDAAHASVFLLVHHDDNSGGLCTATLIAPNLLLTARHCVSPSSGDERVLCGDSPLSTPYPARSFFATNDALPTNDSPVFRAAEVRVPVDEVDTCGYDIALVILSTSVPSELSRPAVPRIDRDVAQGELYTAVGYGVDESGAPTGRRMQLAGLSVDCEPGTCGDGVEASEFLGETGICSGDSGGPALDAEGKVVGVVSRGGADCGTPVYGTVTAWHDFLIESAMEAAALGGYEPPFWATTGSSDPPIMFGEGGASGAAGAGAAGAEEEPEPAREPSREGEDCDSISTCAEGLACYRAAKGEHARCTRTCEQTADCASGQVCQAVSGQGLCSMPGDALDESGGCAVARAQRGSTDSGWLWLVVALAAFRRKLGPKAGRSAAALPRRE